jgi:hypothetical protein
VLAGVHEDISSLTHADAVGIKNLRGLEGKVLFRIDSLSEEYDNNSAQPW